MPEHADALNRPNRISESHTLHMNYSESQPSPSPETFQAHLAAVLLRILPLPVCQDLGFPFTSAQALG